MRKNILITGASSGLGMGMAKEFAKQGCNLALCARRFELLEALKTQLIAINPKAKIFTRTLDVNLHEEVREVFEAFEDDFQSIGESIDRVIINAGIGKGASIGKGYAKQNIMTAQTNFVAVIAQAEIAMEIFRKKNNGHLVFISSISAFRGFPRAMSVYAATKAAVKSLAEGIRIDVMKKPIVVSTIFPGYIQSEMTDSIGKPPPFMVSLVKGSKALVKAINKEKAKAYVPFWPWFLFKQLMPFMPLSFLRKF